MLDHLATATRSAGRWTQAGAGQPALDQAFLRAGSAQCCTCILLAHANRRALLSCNACRTTRVTCMRDAGHASSARQSDPVAATGTSGTSPRPSHLDPADGPHRVHSTCAYPLAAPAASPEPHTTLLSTLFTPACCPIWSCSLLPLFVRMRGCSCTLPLPNKPHGCQLHPMDSLAEARGEHVGLWMCGRSATPTAVYSHHHPVRAW